MSRPLRVATYNLKGLHLDEDAAREVVRELAPDVLGVTEPPRGPTGGWRLRAFARAVGLRVVVGGGGARTTALLVRPGARVEQGRGRRLPVRGGRVRRGFCTAVVDGLTVAVVHLGLDAAERKAHLARVLTSVPPGTSVLVGDLNEQPGRPAWTTLGGVLRDAAQVAADVSGAQPEPTYPATGPRWRIDAVFVGPDLEVLAARVPAGPTVVRASDHRPLVVDLRVPEPGAAHGRMGA